FQAEDGIRDRNVTGVQTCALPIFPASGFQLVVLLPRGLTKRIWAGIRLCSPSSSKKAFSSAHSLECRQHAVQTLAFAQSTVDGRSEERRVGKECRCRWWG